MPRTTIMQGRRDAPHNHHAGGMPRTTIMQGGAPIDHRVEDRGRPLPP